MFSVLAHMSYPVRFWPERQAGPFDPVEHSSISGRALRATALTGEALEVNTRIRCTLPS